MNSEELKLIQSLDKKINTVMESVLNIQKEILKITEKQIKQDEDILKIYRTLNDWISRN